MPIISDDLLELKLEGQELTSVLFTNASKTVGEHWVIETAS